MDNIFRTRICKKCYVEKDINEFFSNKLQNKKCWTCRECRNRRQVERYHLDPIYRAIRRKQGRFAERNDKFKKRDRKAFAIEYLGGACADCGLRDVPQCVYDFHHADPSQKSVQIIYLLMAKKEKLIAELDKCVLLCANCHRKRHWNE